MTKNQTKWVLCITKQCKPFKFNKQLENEATLIMRRCAKDYPIETPFCYLNANDYYDYWVVNHNKFYTTKREARYRLYELALPYIKQGISMGYYYETTDYFLDFKTFCKSKLHRDMTDKNELQALYKGELGKEYNKNHLEAFMEYEKNMILTHKRGICINGTELTVEKLAMSFFYE